MKKLLFIPVAALALFSCKKEQQDQVANVDGFVNQQRDNEFRVQNGSLTAEITGDIDEDASRYAGNSYSEDITFRFVDNNRVNTNENEVNHMTTQDIMWTDEDDEDHSYTEYNVYITMYENEGSNYNDAASDNYVSISFTVYEGDIEPYMENMGISTGEPTYITVRYSLDYNPENSIDYISVSEEISSYEDLNSNDEYTLYENVDISSYEFDESTGQISFDFSASDGDNDRDPSIDEGTVQTEIFYNEILNTLDYTTPVFN